MAGPTVEDVGRELRDELKKSGLAGRIMPGFKVAITGGSRGVSNMLTVYQELVAFVKNAGGEPFIFPSMGSHGGATAEGQVEVLRHLGITEESCGCPIVSSMETDLLGYTNKTICRHILTMKQTRLTPLSW